jgi:hypothetical protein
VPEDKPVFGNIGDIFIVFIVALYAVIAMPFIAVNAARRLPSGFSRRSFTLFVIGTSGPLLALVVTVQKHVFGRNSLWVVLAEIVFFFTLMPLLLRFFIQMLEPSAQLNRAQGVIGTLGLLITGFGIYSSFVR